MDRILKVLVGSRAHGLASETSDADYRGVFVLPTADILSLNGNTKQTSWIEGNDDDTSWELSHFFRLAVHCNPTILETFVAPVIESTAEGDGLRALFPYIWDPDRVRDAFVGYGVNQRKKFLENKDSRASKYAVAYLRTLYQARQLLRTGLLPVDMTDTAVYATLKKWKFWKSEEVDYGEVIGICKAWENSVNKAYEWHMAHRRQQPDIGRVNDYLLTVRKAHW